MKIWLHPYQLRPRGLGTQARHGVLLKVEWEMGQIGYSDLHPWPEFGEPPLDEHIRELSQLRFTPLVENSLEFNYRDREFRLLKRNAFLGLVLPRAHRLVMAIESLTVEQLRDWQQEGYSHIKVKMGYDLKAESEVLLDLICSTPLLWRLDFNARLTSDEFKAWWQNLDAAVKARIDFVEDPVADGDLPIAGPWANDWKTLSRAPVRILKPAREREEDFGRYTRVVFTHSLDHALGQAASLWTAARFYSQHPKRMETCGVAATDFFEPDLFTEQWHCFGPRMKPTRGLGFGFDEQLASVTWERLL